MYKISPQLLFSLSCLAVVNALDKSILDWPVIVFQEGSTAHLPCPPKGHANAFFWRKGEWFNTSENIASIVHGISETSEKYDVLPDGTLIIMDMIPSDEGKYFCRIASEKNECHGSITVYLEVSATALEIAIEGCNTESSCTKVLESPLESHLTCTANMISESMTLKWYNGTTEMVDVDVAVSFGPNAKITNVVTFMFEYDSQLTCEAAGVNIARNGVVIRLKEKNVPISVKDEDTSFIPILVLVVICVILACLLILVTILHMKLRSSTDGANTKKGKKPEEVENGDQESVKAPLIGKNDELTKQMNQIKSDGENLAKEVQKDDSGSSTQKGQKTQNDSGSSTQKGQKTQDDSGSSTQKGQKTQNESGILTQKGQRSQDESGSSTQKGQKTQSESGILTQKGQRSKNDSGSFIQKGQKSQDDSGSSTQKGQKTQNESGILTQKGQRSQNDSGSFIQKRQKSQTYRAVTCCLDPSRQNTNIKKIDYMITYDHILKIASTDDAGKGSKILQNIRRGIKSCIFVCGISFSGKGDNDSFAETVQELFMYLTKLLSSSKFLVSMTDIKRDERGDYIFVDPTKLQDQERTITLGNGKRIAIKSFNVESEADLRTLTSMAALRYFDKDHYSVVDFYADKASLSLAFIEDVSRIKNCLEEKTKDSFEDFLVQVTQLKTSVITIIVNCDRGNRGEREQMINDLETEMNYLASIHSGGKG